MGEQVLKLNISMRLFPLEGSPSDSQAGKGVYIGMGNVLHIRIEPVGTLRGAWLLSKGNPFMKLSSDSWEKNVLYKQ